MLSKHYCLTSISHTLSLVLYFLKSRMASQIFPPHCYIVLHCKFSSILFTVLFYFCSFCFYAIFFASYSFLFLFCSVVSFFPIYSVFSGSLPYKNFSLVFIKHIFKVSLLNLQVCYLFGFTHNIVLFLSLCPSITLSLYSSLPSLLPPFFVPFFNSLIYPDMRNFCLDQGFKGH